MRQLFIIACLSALVVGTPVWVATRHDDAPPRTRVADADEMSVTTTIAPADCELPPGDTTIDSSNLGFAWRSFKAVERASRTDKTTTYSPFSAVTALQMLANGADPGADQELLAALCVRGTSLGELDQQASAKIDALQRGDELSIANGIWTVAPLRPSVRMDTVVQDQFRGEVAAFEGTDAIDAWIEDRTQGRIKDIMGDLPMDTIVMVLANAIAFDGIWTTTFEDARPGTFRVSADDDVEVDMLRKTQKLDYVFSESDPDLAWLPHEELRKEAPGAFHMTRIPYRGGRFAAVVVVPLLDDGLEPMLAQLGPARWRQLRGKLAPTDVALAMPKLDLREEHRIEGHLFDLGMPKGTYNSIFETPPVEPAVVEWVKQATFLQVDEQGTKAAAATVVGVGVAAGGPVGVPVNADHPYLFAIEEIASGELLFLSAIRDPS